MKRSVPDHRVAELPQRGRHLAAVHAAVVAYGHVGREMLAHLGRVHTQGKPLDHAALQHLFHPLVHGGGGQAHLCGHLGVRTTAVGAESRKNSGVNRVYL